MKTVNIGGTFHKCFAETVKFDTKFTINLKKTIGSHTRHENREMIMKKGGRFFAKGSSLKRCEGAHIF